MLLGQNLLASWRQIQNFCRPRRLKVGGALTTCAVSQVHAANRPIPREGGTGHEADALLHQVADRTIGYSGADLANLLNEASILSVSMPCYRPHVRIL